MYTRYSKNATVADMIIIREFGAPTTVSHFYAPVCQKDFVK